ncbi:MAG: serine hydrolase [Flavobacteriales bacterium]
MKLVPSKKFSLPLIILFSFIASGTTFLITENRYKRKIELIEEEQQVSTENCHYQVERMSGYKFVKPLMFVDKDCESKSLSSLKNKVATFIDSYKSTGKINQASIYLRDYNNTAWTAVNSPENYEPGSLFKVPIMICFLKMNELKPGLIDRKLSYNTPFEQSLNVAFKAKSIQLGKSYTIRELLKYMIVYSDNNATMLLNQHIDHQVLVRIFKDLGLAVPDKFAPHYYFTVNQYSMFMRALYNACYLTIEDSEYAAELLSQAVFKEGMRKSIPATIPMAHKFGESGTLEEFQLHESAIVYLKNRPFLLTIMTKGKDNKSLTELISGITKIVFDDMSHH